MVAGRMPSTCPLLTAILGGEGDMQRTETSNNLLYF